ncbi:amino acid deaminase/aldolase [Alkalimarinus coralli]|uniref:amino acid deaminase/aldolase n=1 Tax=Alkalimarinus coralli TaxID=2935863 RepID=UPI00202AC533|nr:amino acid deaminase/aldolase [Alkalimarinus coralli]
MNYQSYKQSLQGQTLPLAYVNLDYLELNANAILQRAGGMPVRVVSKSLRSVDIIKKLLGHSSLFQGVMCFHPDEAVFLAEQGLDDLLVAYPSMQAEAITAVCEATRSGKRIVLMVDSAAHVELIASIAEKVGVMQPVCMEIDMSTRFPGVHFGVRRSPISTPAQAVELYRTIAKKGAVKLEGVMGYEGQIAGVGDQVPGKELQNRAIPWLKRISIPLLTRRRGAVVEALQDAGAKLRFVNGGGTGSIDSTREDPSVTELAVGSGFFSPHLFDYYSDFQYLPAAGFALEVSRLPGSGYATCSGGGYIASGGVGVEKSPKPYLPEGFVLDENEGAGEVQTPLKRSSDKKYKNVTNALSHGDPVLFRHCKAGELCERFNELVLIKNGEVVDKCLTYRGQGKSFI